MSQQQILLMTNRRLAISSTTISVQVASGSDDAEENKANGAVDFASSDLELCRDVAKQQIIGMRFLSVGIPQGATIENAYIQFTCNTASNTELANFSTVNAENADSAAAFTTATNNLSSRAKTTTSVDWLAIPQWVSIGDALSAQQTPELKTVIQEVVDRAGFSESSNIAIFVTDDLNRTANRFADSYDGNSSGAPVLHVTYS